MGLLAFQTSQSGTAMRAYMAVALTTRLPPPGRRARAVQVSHMTMHQDVVCVRACEHACIIYLHEKTPRFEPPLLSNLPYRFHSVVLLSLCI